MAAPRNRLILGCMTFGPSPELGARVITTSGVREILESFHSRGYTELDTARMYVGGQAEPFLSESGYADLHLKVATKVYPHPQGLHEPSRIRHEFLESLKGLKTDCVDTFYLHAADRSIPFVKTLEEVNKLHKEGRFNHLGLSNYASFEVAEIVTLCRAKGWVVPSVYQAMYNPLARKVEKELFPACRRYGIDIAVYNPLAGGLLTSKYEVESTGEVPTEGRFSDSWTMGKQYRDRFFQDRHFEALKILRKAAKDEGIGLVELALRWAVHHSALKLRNKGGNDGVIVGVSGVAQVQQNIDGFEKGPLKQDTVEAIESVWSAEMERGCQEYWRGELEYTYDTLKEGNY